MDNPYKIVNFLVKQQQQLSYITDGILFNLLSLLWGIAEYFLVHSLISKVLTLCSRSKLKIKIQLNSIPV